MDDQYFNFTTHWAEGRWGRHSFLSAWRRLYRSDRRWTPPHFPTLRRALAAPPAHLARAHFLPFHLEALRRPLRRRNGEAMWNAYGAGGSALMEEPVAAAIALADPRRPGAAYLALMQCANDEECVERLLAAAAEQLRTQGVSTVYGPTALSPHLPSGVLASHYHLAPPLHTPYNPPFLADLLAELMTPVQTSRLYVAAAPPGAPPAAGPARLEPLEPPRLAGDLLPLFQAAMSDQSPLPDAAEVEFLLDWIGFAPVFGWLACVEGKPVGFCLLQPDWAPLLRRTGGARTLLGRTRYAWGRPPATAGRLLWGGVLPAWRRQGIGSQLWAQALHSAAAQGWRTLSAGPFDQDTSPAAFWTAGGAAAQQRYMLFQAGL